MADRKGFDNEKYLKEQTAAILGRVNNFKDKLYLEFGGKIIYDMHAARVLPGFEPNVKMRLLQKLRGSADIIVCIYAGDIERKKVRADFGITYDTDVMRLIDDLREWGISVAGVVITRYDGQASADIFRNKLERRGIKVYTHRATKGYPTDVDIIVSDEGYGSNEYINTSRKLVVVTAPGPGSGKLATCLSQLYHDHKNGINSGYAKFETFPIWNLPLKHPVNIAYEAATADIRDFNMIDSFHLSAYGKTAVNYNRDVEVFPVIKRILERIMGKEVYKSPTDMGVNRAGFGIIDDAVVSDAAKQEIIRRFYRYSVEYAIGFVDRETVDRTRLILEELGLNPADRKTAGHAARAARAAQEKSGSGDDRVFCGAAIELDGGMIITGKNSPLMNAASSLVLNAVKALAEIPDKIHLLAPNIIESIGALKKSISGGKPSGLDLEETLIALGISAATNPAAQLAMEKLKELRGCEVHLTHIPPSGDEAGLRSLGVNLTSDAVFITNSLYMA